jgi:2-dehydro-3-deoxygluconokinase
MTMKVVAMGEMMLRLMPEGHLKFEQAVRFEAHYGGDESIVASSLAHFGLHSLYVTKLPDNPLGRIAAGKLREQGVDVSAIAWGGGRMGINFYENGASVRPSKVLYDRKHSAMSEAAPEDFDFDAIFQGADWFHVAGITPALSDRAARLTEEAMESAKRHGATVSVDLNYRSKLWSPAEAQRVMIPLMRYVDVLIGNEEDAEKSLGFKPENTDVTHADLDVEGYKAIFERMRAAFGFKYIASTLRESHSASDNGWSALLYDGTSFFETPKYQIHLVDRGGGGASFAAGLIYSILNGFNLEKAGKFAAAASALKQTILGDFNLASLEDVLALADGDASGRVQR